MTMRWKIILGLFVIFAIVGGIVGTSTQLYSSNLIRARAYSYLSSISHARTKHIHTFLEDQKEMALILAAASVYLDFLSEPRGSAEYPVIKEKIDRRLERTRVADPHIVETFIIDKNGVVIASSDPSREGTNESENSYFTEGRKGVFIQNMLLSGTTGMVTYAVAAPVTGEQQKFLGISVLRYEPSKLYAITESDDGLGETEESFLINRDGFFLTPPQFLGPSAVLTERAGAENISVCFSGTDYPEIGEVLDYRNVEIISSRQYIPETDWCLITKIDQTELLKPVNQFLVALGGALVASFLAFVIAAYFIARKITNPIQTLKEGVSAIGRGEFDFKAEVTSNDELGELGRAFNTMATAVKESRKEIDAKVKEQTEKIRANAEMLEKQQRATLNILEDVSAEREKSERLAAIVRNADEAIIGKTADGTITSWNRGAENLFGYAADEAIGKSIRIIVPKDKLKEEDQIIKSIGRGEEVKHLQTVRIRKDGSTVYVSLSLSPIKNPAGDIIGISTIVIDTTKETQIDRAKTEFVSLASHQLRTPISAVNWYAEMLLAGDLGKLTDKQKQFIEEIYHGNQRMVELVNALLNASRIELGTFIIEPKPTDIAELARNVLKELKQDIQKKKLVVMERFDAKLPPVNLDPQLMRMVIQNLLSNAVKYTPDEGSITCSIEQSGKNFTITVTDTGCGIPKNQQDKIFTKLFRAENVREKDVDGTGLGLYIVKSIIDNASGSIKFVSEENKGSTFSVTFPLSGMRPKEGTKKLN